MRVRPQSVAMKDDWAEYKREVLRYLLRAPLGLPIALIPFLLSYAFWQERGAVQTGLIISLVFGVVIPFTVWFSYAAVYGVRNWLALRTGRTLQVPLAGNIAINVVGMIAGVWLAQWINHRLYGFPVSGGTFWAALIFGGVFIVIFSLHYAYRESKEESLQLQAAVAESRYHALAAQMRPHFLFNALNSLAELIESRQEQAADVAYQLSELYRRILANSGHKTASLASELEIARSYLELEQLRFGKRLEFKISAPPETEQIFLPSLMLQTLVENAVKHGIAPAVAGGALEIEITPDPTRGYRLCVTNTGAPLVTPVNAEGAGLANTRARLALLYGDDYDLTLQTDERSRTVACCSFTGAKID